MRHIEVVTLLLRIRNFSFFGIIYSFCLSRKVYSHAYFKKITQVEGC